MEEFFMQDGKKWVVLAVILAIFIGIISYLIRLDVKLKNLEK
jgi:CcmD family protein